MPTRLRICALAALPPGTRCVVDIHAYEAYEEVLVLNVDGTIYALSNICPHAGAALQRGPVTGGVLYCPLHRWGFSLASGQSLDEPTLWGRTYPVETYDGYLFLCLP